MQKQKQTSSDMSSNTNQSSASPDQHHMATLQQVLGAPTTQTLKQAKNSFIGGGGESNNPPETATVDLGRCRKWGERGKPETQCTRPATVQPHKGKNSHLVYCAECWELKKQENKKSCKTHRASKKAKIKHEKQKILQVVNSGTLNDLSLMEKQYQVITLGLAFMSQVVSVRNAFHSTLKSVRTDGQWTHEKKAAASRSTGARRKALCHYRTFGTRRDWKREIEGSLTADTVFVLKTLFEEVKSILPNNEIITIETLRLVVTDTPGWEVPHFAEKRHLKGEERWGWSFHLSLCEEGAHLFLWEKAQRTIQKVHIPFGCALLTRSDVCHAGLGNSQGNMMLQGNLFAPPMWHEARDLPEYLMEPGEWAKMTADAASITSSKIVTQEINLIKDELLADQVAGTATQLRNYYTFSTDFLDCMKMK